MNDLKILEQILKNQNEIKYFCYFVVYEEKTGIVKMHLSASGITKKYKFKSIDLCLNKITEIINDLKNLEKYYLSKS